MRKLSTLTPGQRFLFDPADCIEYRYLWEATNGKHTAAPADQPNEWTMFPDQEVYPL